MHYKEIKTMVEMEIEDLITHACLCGVWMDASTNISVKKLLLTQLSHKQLPANSNSNSEKQEEKRSVDNQAGTQFADSKLLMNWRKRHWMKRGWEQNQFSN